MSICMSRTYDYDKMYNRFDDLTFFKVDITIKL